MEALQTLDKLPAQMDSFQSKIEASFRQFRDSYRADLRASFQQIFELVRQHYNLEEPNDGTVVESPFTAADYGIPLGFHNKGLKSEASRYIAEVPIVHGAWQFQHEIQSSLQQIPEVLQTENATSTGLGQTCDGNKTVEKYKAGQTVKMVEIPSTSLQSSTGEHESSIEVLFSAINGDIHKMFEEMRPRVKMKKNLASIRTVPFKHRARIEFHWNRYKVTGDTEGDMAELCKNKSKHRESLLKRWREGIQPQQLATSVISSVIRNKKEILHKGGRQGAEGPQFQADIQSSEKFFLEVPSNSNVEEDNLHCLLKFFNDGRHQHRFCANGVTSDALIKVLPRAQLMAFILDVDITDRFLYHKFTLASIPVIGRDLATNPIFAFQLFDKIRVWGLDVDPWGYIVLSSVLVEKGCAEIVDAISHQMLSKDFPEELIHWQQVTNFCNLKLFDEADLYWRWGLLNSSTHEMYIPKLVDSIASQFASLHDMGFIDIFDEVIELDVYCCLNQHYDSTNYTFDMQDLLGDWICDLGPKLMRMLDVEKENLHTDMIASVGNNDLELVAYGNKERLQFHLKRVINTHDVKVDLFFLLPAANKRIKQIGVIGCGSKGSAQGSETLADEWKAVSGNDLVLLWDSEALKAKNYEKVLSHILPNNFPGAMDIESVMGILETKNSGGSFKTKRMVALSICYMWISWVFLGVKIFRWLGVPNFVEDSRPRIKLKANYSLITDVTQIMEELAQVSGLNDVSYTALQQSNSLKNSSYQVEISSTVQGFLESSSKQQTNRTIYGFSAVFLEGRNSCYLIKNIHSEQLGFRLDFRGLIADTINHEIALQVLQAKVVLNINLFKKKQLDSNGVAYKGSVDGFTAEFFEDDVASKHNGDFSGVPKSVSRVMKYSRNFGNVMSCC